jgi:hypothetical protein
MLQKRVIAPSGAGQLYASVIGGPRLASRSVSPARDGYRLPATGYRLPATGYRRHEYEATPSLHLTKAPASETDSDHGI